MSEPTGSVEAPGTFRWTRLADAGLEDAYRRHYLRQDGRTASLLLAVFAVAATAYGFLDWRLLGAVPRFWALLALRAVFVGGTIGIALWSRRARSWRIFDGLLLGALLALETLMLASASTRPRDFHMTLLVDVAAVNAIWTVLPARFAVQLAGAATFLAGQVILLRYFRDPLPAAIVPPVVFAYALAHGAGIPVALRFHRARRREWLARERIARDREELAAASEAAEAASRAKSTFLAGVSHEILTPLNAVLGFSEELRRRQPRPEDQEPLSAIHAAATTLHGLLVDVLDMARGEAVTSPLRPRATDPSALVADVARLLAPRASERRLWLRVEGEPSPPRLLVDSDRVRQVLLNLGANAIRFTHAGGITIRHAVEDRGERGLELVLSVADTGVGIPAGEQATIFEPFRQRSGQDAARYGGTGLGLALSRRLVERMGGRIEVESAVDRGSIFTVFLPAGAAPATAQAEPSPSEWVLPPSTILIADDEPWNRALLRSYLAGQAVRMVEAEDGVTALEALRAGAVELALLDVQMPGLGGLAIVERVRGDRAASRPRLVMTSAQPPEVEGGWDGWLRKPFSREELLDAIGPLLDGAQRVDSPRGDEVRARPATTLDPAWLDEAASLATAPHAGHARSLADRVAAAAREAGDPLLAAWAAAVRARADALDADGLRGLLEGLAAGQLNVPS